MTAATLSDSELKKAFAEGQSKLFDLQRQLNVLRAQLQNKMREKKIAEVTITQLEEYGETVPMYKTVGKMFLMSSMKDITAELKTKIQTANEDEKTLATKEKWLERSIQDTTDNLKDMLDKRSA